MEKLSAASGGSLHVGGAHPGETPFVTGRVLVPAFLSPRNSHGALGFRMGKTSLSARLRTSRSTIHAARITMGEHPVGITWTSPTKAAFPPSLSAVMALAHDSRAVSRIRPFHHPLRRRWARANTTHLLGCWHGAVGVCSAGYAAAGVRRSDDSGGPGSVCDVVKGLIINIESCLGIHSRSLWQPDTSD